MSPPTTAEQWVYTWESQAQIPALKLFLFNPLLNHPLPHHSLNLSLRSPLLLSLSFNYAGFPVELFVPTPSAVLIDSDVPPTFRVLHDHVEVRFALVLPVDHPVVRDLWRMTTTTMSAADEDEFIGNSDVKILSSEGSLDLYCRNCSTKLTAQPICHFIEMPSGNWQEAADNWFGSCCCSFGGVSEKLVNRYSMSYACTKGKCFLNSTTVIISKDDLLGFEFPEMQRSSENEDQLIVDSDNNSNEVITDLLCGQGAGITCHQPLDGAHKMTNGRASMSDLLEAETTENDDKAVCCHHNSHLICEQKTADDCNFGPAGDDFKHHSTAKQVTDPLNKKHFLNGFLGDVFMTRSHNLSSDIKWVDLACPKCSVLLGAYPSTDGCAPLDGGIRLIKCYISTDLPVGGTGDIFKNYTLEGMFSNKILESAKDELSFRSIIRDLKTKFPSLQIVLLNPNCWLSTGRCLTSDSTHENTRNPGLEPVIKLLFDNCNDLQSKSRLTEEWVARTRNQADEVHMLSQQIKLSKYLASGTLAFPPSMASIQGSALSYTRR